MTTVPPSFAGTGVPPAFGSPTIDERSDRFWHRLSWGAVIAGVAVAFAVQLVLAMAGAAIGLAAWGPDSTARSFGIGAAIWALIALLVPVFLGGAVTGLFSNVRSRQDGFVHGLLLWALFLMLTLWLVASRVGAITSGVFNVVGSAVGTTAGALAQGAGAAATNASGELDFGALQREIGEVLRQTGDPALSPESLRALGAQAGDSITRSDASNAATASEIADLFRNRLNTVGREDVVNVIVARTGQSRAEAARLADRVMALRTRAEAGLANLQTQATEVVQDVAGATTSGLWLALLGIGLSLGAAVLGTLRAAPEPVKVPSTRRE